MMHRLPPWVALVAALGLPANAAPPAPVTTPEAPVVETDDPPTTAQLLIAEIQRLRVEAVEMRRQLADANIRAAAAERELDELRTFIEDHDRLGDDYEQYRAVLAVAEEQARREAAERRRQERAAELEARRERRQEAMAERRAEQAARERDTYYERRGFAPLGLDVYLSRMSFAYRTADATASRVDYAPGFGNYLRLYPGTTIDYSTMTISGSVLNAAAELRNIGVAITFFDQTGNQVGQEIVQVNNARPDVPYPFTATIDMVTDEPFASSSQYVLYSDAVAVEE